MGFPRAAGPAVYLLHDNDEWLPPFRAALDTVEVPYRTWPLTEGSVDLDDAPPEGVFWSRLSASAHTRGAAHARETARSVLRWAEAYGRTVVNGSRAVELEVSKVAQHVALRRAGFDVPHTIAVFDLDEAPSRARELAAPFITKHNQGGKGLGVRRFDSHEEFDAALAGQELGSPIDGVLLLQEYLPAAEPFVTRAEFVGGSFVYAVRVDTSAGSFELCPADACVVPDEKPEEPPFRLRTDVTAATPLIARLADFLAAEKIDIAGIEYIETEDGRAVPYDVNTNTNYNPAVEASAPVTAADTVAAHLARLLDRVLLPTP